MPASSEHLPDLLLKLSGEPAAAETMQAIWEVRVESTLHLPDVATLVFNDPELTLVDDPHLELGKEVILISKVERQENTIFEGEIVEVEPEYRVGEIRLLVRVFDRLHRFSRGRQIRRFTNVTDGDVVKQMAKEAGFSRVELGDKADDHVYDWLFQNNETNLAFMQRRASSLGYVVYMRGQTLHFVPPQADQTEIELKFGETLTEFSPRITTLDQPGEVVVRGWDVEKKQAVVGKAKRGDRAPKVGVSQQGGELASQAFGESVRLVQERPVRSQREAQRIADAAANKQSGRFIQAEGLSGGNPAIVAGAKIKLQNIGRRFSGEYVVTTAVHIYAQHPGRDRYTTAFTVSAQEANTLLELLRPEPQPGLGVAVGVVTNNDDPKGWGRVRVRYPALSDEAESDWARVVSVGAGKERGLELIPEVHDEVLVAFEMGDPDHPYVLGGLWNGVDLPPKKSNTLVKSGKTQQRIMRSRLGHLIVLDDSDDTPGITIEDKSGNKIHLNAKDNKLTVEIKGDVNLKAEGNAEVKVQGDARVEAQGSTKVAAQQSLELSGMEVRISAQTSLKLEGNATVEVKGGIIKLN